LLANWKKFTVT